MFAGILVLSPNDTSESFVDAETLHSALSPFRKADRYGCMREDSACLIEQRVFNGPHNRDETLPLRCPETGIALAFWGRLDNRGELARLLGIDDAASPSDAQLVMSAWLHWGEAMPEQLLGDFVLAVLDPAQHRVFLARDPLGVKPLYYRIDGRALAFATSVAALKNMKGLTLTPDTGWMARYMLHLSMSDKHTAYEEIAKLPPGHCMTVDQAGQKRLRRWFFWRDEASDCKRRDLRQVDAYREVLEEAIRCRMISDHPLGTENSGGIDSATITAYLAHFMGEPGNNLHSFGFAMCEQEPAFILETSQAHRIVHNYLITAPNDEGGERIARTLKVLGYPEEHGNGSGHTPFYKECGLRGIRTLFSGFGGDEVVTNHGHHLPLELLDEGRYAQLLDILPGNPLFRFLRLGKAMLMRRKSPQYNLSLLQTWNARWPHQLLRGEVVAELGLYEQFMETARYDAPYRRINDFILQGLLKMPYIATRMENCTLMAASYGIDYRWPLWDVRLVQQYLSTPSVEKVGPQGIGRYLHRRAIDGVVPHSVAWKPSKDMGYAKLRQQTRGANIIRAAELAQEQEKNLHPTLEALIDRDKFRQQIARAALGNADESFTFAFMRATNAIRNLNLWLHEDA